MPDKIIAAKLALDTEEAQRNVLKLNGIIDDYKKQVKAAVAGSDEQLAAFKKLKAAEEDLVKANKNLIETQEKSSGHFSNLKDKIGQVGGPLGQASEGVNKLSGTLKALLLNPVVLAITLIVGALALLYKAFTSTNDGADKMEQIFAGVGSAINVIRDRILKIGEAITKFFSGDFSGALKDGKAAVSGIGEEIAREFSAAAKATKVLQDLEDEVLNLGVSRSKLNRDLALAKELISDTNATYKERKKAIDEVREAEQKQTQAELDAAKRSLAAKKEKFNLSDKSDEQLKELAEAESKVYSLEEQSAKDIRSLNKQERSIESEEVAKSKEARDKAISKRKEEQQKLSEFTNKLQKLQQENNLAIIKDGYEKELAQLTNKINDEKKANQIAVEEGKLTKLQQQKLNAELDIKFANEKSVLDKKSATETAKKEADFQKELAAIKKKTAIDSITDVRQVERVQLQLGYEEKLNDAINRYKDDQLKFMQIKQALDEQLKAEQAKLDEKFKKEDDKKKFDLDLQKAKAEADKKGIDNETKLAAIDEEQLIIQTAFDNKILSEVEYNSKLKELADARMQISDLEAENKVKTFNIIAQATNSLADIIGKGTAAGKAAAIASTIITTYEAAWSIFRNAAKNPASIPFPAYPYIQAGLAIVAGLANVQKIVSVKTPSGGGGGSVPSSGALAAPIAPAASSTRIDQQSLNQIGNATVRAYVVDHDAQTNRERNERLNRAARLGG